MTTNEIRKSLCALSGARVNLYAVMERNRILEACGTLDGIYPDIFTVSVENDGYTKRYCFSYREVLTDHVRISPIFAAV